MLRITFCKAGGVYHKGTVRQVLLEPPGPSVPLSERSKYDPWESVEIVWERTAKAEPSVQRESPWEMELDPVEQARRDAEAARLDELAARLARAEAKARR